jgi:hypothetical protein
MPYPRANRSSRNQVKRGKQTVEFTVTGQLNGHPFSFSSARTRTGSGRGRERVSGNSGYYGKWSVRCVAERHR